MSLFSWFSKKATPNPESPAHNSDLDSDLSTVPLMASGRSQARRASLPVEASGSRKTERIERREQLYGVVRDAMTRAGILSASYKFKVLSLDPRGKQYLIMMDLSNRSAGDADRLAEIESLIAQTAKSRYEILVTAVYWRVNANVTAGLSSARPGVNGTVLRPAPLSAQVAPATAPTIAATIAAKVAASAVGHGSRYEPLQADEVIAFKKALATSAPAAILAGSGEIVKSGRRNPALQPDFEITELIDPEERVSPLSSTQYGELN